MVSLRVETLSGSAYSVELDKDSSIAHLKEKLAYLTNVPVFAQKILAGRRILTDTEDVFQDSVQAAMLVDGNHRRFAVLLDVDCIAPPITYLAACDSTSQPHDRVGHSLVRASASLALLFGGVSRRSYRNDVFRFDVETLTFMDASPPSAGQPRPPARSDHAACFYGGRMYVAFGRNQRDYFVSLWSFDPESRTWAEIPVRGPAPPGRARAAHCLHSHQWIFFGGYGAQFQLLNDLWMLNLDSMTWVNLKLSRDQRPPPPLAGASLNVVGERLFLIGGLSSSFSNAAFILDLDRLRWTLAPTRGAQPTPRAFHTSASFGRKVVLFGGSNGNSRFSSFHVLDTETLMWNVPELLAADSSDSRLAGRIGHAAVRMSPHSWLIYGGETGQSVLSDLAVLPVHAGVMSAPPGPVPAAHVMSGVEIVDTDGSLPQDGGVASQPSDPPTSSSTSTSSSSSTAPSGAAATSDLGMTLGTSPGHPLVDVSAHMLHDTVDHDGSDADQQQRQ